MTRLMTILLAATLLMIVSGVGPGEVPVRAQNRTLSLTAEDGGHVTLGLAIRRLSTTGVFLQAGAHPDDENNALLAWLSRGLGMRAAVLTTTRGNGGQNEIGPELFEDLAVVRTSELLSAHRLDGAEQYFGRAVDFGFSFSPEETYRKWGRQELLSDIVRHLRTIRPDVILVMPPASQGGGQHHQATATLTQEAFRIAADPAQFPEQIKEGLRPWQARKFYINGGPPPGAIGAVGVPGGRPNAPRRPVPAADAKGTVVDANVYDPLLGMTFNELGWEARSYHKCQGTGQIVPLPGPAPARYVLADSVVGGTGEKPETWIFDGVDTSIAGLAQYAGGKAPEALTNGLAAIGAQAARARETFDTAGDTATQAPILAGLAAVRALRSQLQSLGLDQSARYEIDVRLATKEREFQDAAVAAFGLTFRALADDGLVVRGQPLNVTLFAANQAGADVTMADAAVSGFDGRSICSTGTIEKGGTYSCEAAVRIPADAKLTAPYWKSVPGFSRSEFEPDVPFGAPFRPSPFRATFRLRMGGQDVTVGMPVTYRYQQDIFIGEKQMELNVVPAFSVKTTPELAMVPTAAAEPAAKGHVREIHVAVTTGLKAAADATVVLAAPAGWTVTPPSARLSFAREDESRTVRFTVAIPAGAEAGEYKLQASVTSPAAVGESFDRGYQVVDYPHIQRRHVINMAETGVKIVDVRVAPGIRVGYIVGVGDQVPPALEQLGARVSFIGADELAWGDLSKYDVIMTGVRAYERREDLRAYNQRLIEFAE
ncbi:MAG: PIG-L family deacetylase, partial [Acidobacteria bacterium]|nr:PIG-L family deacetylase [Acidobacteriota bacterium]